MLGINVSDAVLVGSLIAGLVAMLRGARSGEAAAKTNPPDPAMAILGATMVDTATFRDLVEVLADINATMRLGISAQQDRANSRFVELLEEISEKLDGEVAKPRRRT